MSRFVAVDWGTTNRRAYLIDNRDVVSTERDDRGIVAMGEGGFEAEVAALQARYDGAPMLLAGMVGSNRGWIDAGYVSAPAGFDDLAAKAVHPRANIAIVPGVSRVAERRGDVMRGEEVQLLGAVAAGLAPGNALLCQPGTHCKWARMADGAIADFVTAMTGEMFAVLRDHALIGREMVGEPGDDAAFLEGVADSRRGDLLGSLFGVRSARLLNLRPQDEAASYVSGLLIGSDCRAHVQAGEAVYLLADGMIGALYAHAIAAVGATAHPIDSQSAFIAGITRIQDRLA